VGFCGFLVFPGPIAEPQLVYALAERFTGRGLATEMARFCVDRARDAGSTDVWASVDAVNVASVRVLERIGFRRDGTAEGAFGEMWIYRLPAFR
jgi:RimJ/RimL family protein N-acetyltransferase